MHCRYSCIVIPHGWLGAGSTNIAATVLAVCKSFASICKCIGACALCGGPLLQKSLNILFDGGVLGIKQGIC